MKLNVAVTGASGFIGRQTVEYIHHLGHSVTAFVNKETFIKGSQTTKIVENIASELHWEELLKGIDVVVHLAGRAHNINESNIKIDDIYKQINCDATIEIARASANVGARRFIFLSSIKVNGEKTSINIPFKVNDIPKPEGPYSKSKYMAEQGLFNLSKSNSLEITVIRPPLVYGNGMKGNLMSLKRVLELGLPLPFGGFNTNSRSLVSIQNLVSLIGLCLDHPSAANQIFLVKDQMDISTSSLIYFLAEAYGLKSRIFTMPVFLLNLLFKIIGKSSYLEKMQDNLVIDDSETHKILDWTPPLSLYDGFKLLGHKNELEKNLND